MPIRKKIIVASFIILYLPAYSFGDAFIVTLEDPGIQQTRSVFFSVGMETFDSRTTAATFTSSFSTQVGSYSLVSGLTGAVSFGQINSRTLGDHNPPLLYGGAGGVGAYPKDLGSITLNTSINYFGLWISAMNGTNTVKIYREFGGELLNTFNLSSMSALVGSSSATNLYYGNPNWSIISGLGSTTFANQFSAAGGEPFAFVNFYDTTSGSGFKYITIDGGGFESDNWTVGNYRSLSGTDPNNPSAPYGLTTDILLGTTTTTDGVITNFNPKFDGGTLKATATISNSSNFAITSAGGIIDNNSNNTTFSGVFSDDVPSTPASMSFINSGSGGTIYLTGRNTYTGATSIGSGTTLALTGAGSVATSSAVNVSGTFDISGTTSGASVISLSGSGSTILGSKTLTLTNAAGTYSGVMSGTGGLTITGGSETLSGANTYTGATNINGGTLNLTGSLASNTVTLAGGTFINANSGLATGTNLTITNGNANINGNQTIATFNGSGGSVAIASNKTLNINNGGLYAGLISGPGGLTINGGAQTLSGTNTISGAITVNSGAQLNINSSSALGTGLLDLVGSATVPATLAISQTTTISNAIKVSGDPVFNVASGTTTTVSAAIIDGVSAGDVVVSGGGTLALTAANTYTGNTTVDSGSTLVLSGGGSIATSGTDATVGTGVFNNGTFNVSGLSANTVSLGSRYTQSSSGTLAMNFSPSSNQKLSVTGVASLAGTLALIASSGTYSAGKYTLLTASSVSGTFSSLSTNLGAYTNLGYALTYDNSNVYLYFTPNIALTQASLQQMANNLKGTYALQTSAINIGLTYDCNTFDSNKICVSTGGRYTRVSTGDNSTNGLLIGAYKLNDKVRLGAYLDQNLSSSNAASGINLSNSNPLFGVFGVWNHQADQLGYSVRVAAGYGDRDLSLTRQVIGTSEAGSGSTRLNSQAASITGSYSLPVHSQWIASPYVGVRYTKVSSSAYSEQATITVTSPLTFDSLVQETTTALAGVKLSGNLMPKIGLFGSLGVEQDLNNHGDNYSATGITGLTAINFNPNLQKTRPVANLGASYQIDKTQQISFNMTYRQEVFQSTNTLTSLLTYSAGL